MTAEYLTKLSCIYDEWQSVRSSPLEQDGKQITDDNLKSLIKIIAV